MMFAAEIEYVEALVTVIILTTQHNYYGLYYI